MCIRDRSLAREIDRALSTLTDREKEIIQMFFGIGQQEMTLEEIGDKFGLTRAVSYTHLDVYKRQSIGTMASSVLYVSAEALLAIRSLVNRLIQR